MREKFISVLKNKWLRKTTSTLVLVAIIIAAYIGINIGIEKLNITDIDLTKEKVYSISQESKDKLGDIDQEVTIYLLNMDQYQSVSDFIGKYSNVNKNFKIEKVENIESRPDWTKEYGLNENSSVMVFQSGDKEKLLSNYDLYTFDYNTSEEIDITEEAITNAILDVTVTKKPKIYFLSGHNAYSEEYMRYFRSALTSEANEVEDLDLLTTTKVPDDADVLVILTLKEDIKEIEKDAIIKYIKKGGKIMLLTDPNVTNIKLTNFQKVLDQYGINISSGVILEEDPNKMLSGSPNFIIASMNPEAGIMSRFDMNMNICLMNAGKISFKDSDKLTDLEVSVEYLATASEKAFYRSDLEIASMSKTDSDETASGAAVGALLTKKINDKTESKLIVFSNNVFATNNQIPVSTQYYMYAIDFYNNKDILLNSMSYLTEREDTITIRKDIEVVSYTVTEEQNRIILGIIFSVPVLIIITGIVVWQFRRRKK